MTTLTLPFFTSHLIEISFKKRARVAKHIADDPLSEAKSLLLDRIENGYTDPETGKHHELPRLARTQCAMAIKCMGWV